MKIAIASGKGGTGKTFVTTNLYYTLLKQGKKVHIVDCDSEEPNVGEFISGHITQTQEVFQNIPVIDATQCIYCGKCYEYCSYNAIVYLPMGPFIQAIGELCHDCGACSLMCETGAITEIPRRLGTITHIDVTGQGTMTELRADIGVYTPVPILKKALSQITDDTLNLLDSPPGISCPFIATADQADFLVLVTEPTPFGLNDLKLTVETLRELKKPFGVVINRAGLGDNTLYQWLQAEQIPLLLEIPFDREIARIYSEGQILVNCNEDYLKQFEQLAEKIFAMINTPAKAAGITQS
ncbi:MAG: ATP-binding protein [Marinilabiliaceae bacterium]|nr:ATP-binding protein [Marinilabiliaceae bacterium]